MKKFQTTATAKISRFVCEKGGVEGQNSIPVEPKSQNSELSQKLGAVKDLKSGVEKKITPDDYKKMGWKKGERQRGIFKLPTGETTNHLDSEKNPVKVDENGYYNPINPLDSAKYKKGEIPGLKGVDSNVSKDAQALLEKFKVNFNKYVHEGKVKENTLYLGDTAQSIFDKNTEKILVTVGGIDTLLLTVKDKGKNGLISHNIVENDHYGDPHFVLLSKLKDEVMRIQKFDVKEGSDSDKSKKWLISNINTLSQSMEEYFGKNMKDASIKARYGKDAGPLNEALGIGSFGSRASVMVAYGGKVKTVKFSDILDSKERIKWLKQNFPKTEK